MEKELPPLENSPSEVGYRRGYRQGYNAALDDVRYKMTTWGKLYKFFNKKLIPWSYFKDKKKIYCAPEYSKGE